MTDEKMYIEIEGIVENIIYTNSVNGYTVAEIGTATELITVIGTMPYLGEGESVKLTGEWMVHPNFGRQFRVEVCEKKLPSTSTAILKYLSSGIVKGIGPASAKRIVDKFGEDSLDVCENHPEWLADVKGITKEKAKAIGDAFAEQFGLRSIISFCRDFFGISTAMRIFKRWGRAAVEIVSANPYILCDEIYGVNFVKADAFAKAKGVADDAPERISAALKYILSHNASQNGHVYIPENKLVQTCKEYLNLPEDAVKMTLECCITAGSLKREQKLDKFAIYLLKYYNAEHYTAQKLVEMLNTGKIHKDIIDIDKTIEEIENDDRIEYAPKQKEAIRTAVENGVMVLTGGPGTGKTTIVKAILQILSKSGISVALAAPTGRSAKRLELATGCEASTIHRMLEADINGDSESTYSKNEKNPLSQDFIIIDEASMIDIMLMEALLRAIKPGAQLLLIGDKDQLPAVGAGNVLCDIINSGEIPTVSLKEIYRQASESQIIVNAHMINSGEYPTLERKDADFFFLHRDSPEEVNDTVTELVKYRLPHAYKELAKDVQVIIPSHKGKNGTDILNVVMQKAINPPGNSKVEIKVGDRIFREGDKVMQIRNDYNITWQDDDGISGSGVYNGDIGYITYIDMGSEKVYVNFDNRKADYDFPMLDELEHAYAITVHKSQGSEYPIVVLPLYDFPKRLQTRNLLYTAITRAQNILIIVGRKEVVYRMVDNYKESRRYTGLDDAIADYFF